MAGIERIPIRYPNEAPEWFVRFMNWFVRDVLVHADVRNAVPGSGVSIEGTPDQPATISAAENIQQFVDESFVLAEVSGALANARVLHGEGGVVDVTDGGPGQIITIGLTQHGLPVEKIEAINATSVLGNPSSSMQGPVSVTAYDDDTILLRASGELRFGSLTADMASDGLWANAKLADMAQGLVKGRAKLAGTGPPTDLTPTELAELLNTFTDVLPGMTPASGGGTTKFLRADASWEVPPGGGGGGGDGYPYALGYSGW
ncbi:MAG: hypothetical protein IT480_06490 [Gammaproteobacteria bacterium]|nr:hypothetical protein [Gammaproteobacteria bacterium]